MSSVYIIAEAGVNHNGSLELARQLIDVAVEARADAVKFQTFKADKLISTCAPKAEYQLKTTDSRESQLEMIKKLELDENAHEELIKYCRLKGIQFLSTPFDMESVDLLAGRFNLLQLKVPSGEITNGPLLLRVALTGKPVILSTGMSTLGEIETALGVLAFGYTRSKEEPALNVFQAAYWSKEGQQALRQNVTLLHCTTEYPAPFEEVNLLAMDTLRSAFGLSVGYSDHAPGIAVSIAAAARGAAVIEKHFTLSRALPGPDHKASLEPYELTQMIKSIRQVEKAIGSNIKYPAQSELNNAKVARKSLVAARDINKGEIFTEENVAAKRPGTGVSPMFFWDCLGRKADRDYRRDEMINL
ncbi:MAG: hypothetical protein VR69_11725 [Peptococcaceae bacterium BRH_c4b]|nr:MAG: hypothetical protein VR69_11725 [Peptococcaceae bacterium BRH_c4b]